ncbi:hypothetical protein THAOC_01252, partial [Thalassiosira oceanica]
GARSLSRDGVDGSCIRRPVLRRGGSEQAASAGEIAQHVVRKSASQSSPGKPPVRVALLHSPRHTRVLHAAMLPVHSDRDVLLAALLRCCGFLSGAAEGGPLSSFLGVVSPLVGTRELLETFHGGDYLDLLECPRRADVADCRGSGVGESNPVEGSGQTNADDAGASSAGSVNSTGDRPQLAENETNGESAPGESGLTGVDKQRQANEPTPTSESLSGDPSSSMVGQTVLTGSAEEEGIGQATSEQDSPIQPDQPGNQTLQTDREVEESAHNIGDPSTASGSANSIGVPPTASAIYGDSDNNLAGVSELGESTPATSTDLRNHGDESPGTNDEDGDSYPLPAADLLSRHGLEDDCPYPSTRREHALLWEYCLAVAGASYHAASLLAAGAADVAVHWGGGRHHASRSKAGGFCYVNDIVIAIKRLLLRQDQKCLPGSPRSPRRIRRVLYLDIDVHSGDGVQGAFYSTDEVLTVSFHRHSPGFYPADSGSPDEKGKAGTAGYGYNLNVPLPAGTDDALLLAAFRKALFGLVRAYDPDAVAMCVGADGLAGDPLVSGGSGEGGDGWRLSPEGIAECVRLTATVCAGVEERPVVADKSDEDPIREMGGGRTRGLLVLGGGGYDPARTARTHLLCTAAACEGSRPGMFAEELPGDVPGHGHWARYGPTFELASGRRLLEIQESRSGRVEDWTEGKREAMRRAGRLVETAALFIERKRNGRGGDGAAKGYSFGGPIDEEDVQFEVPRRRRKRKKGACPVIPKGIATSSYVTAVNIRISPPGSPLAYEIFPKMLRSWAEDIQFSFTEIGPFDLHWPGNTDKAIARE